MTTTDKLAEALRPTFEKAFMAHYTNGAHLLERFDTGHYRSEEARAAWRIARECRAAYEAEAKPQPGWCKGCTPESCPGCGGAKPAPADEREAFEAWADTQVGSTDSTKNRRSIIDVWQEEGIRAALEAKPAEPVPQWRKVGCCDWHDGHPDKYDGGGPYETRTLYRAAPAAPAEPVEPDPSQVICPNCCHQFRAIPTDVQRLMLNAGFEPPFAAPAAPSKPIQECYGDCATSNPATCPNPCSFAGRPAAPAAPAPVPLTYEQAAAIVGNVANLGDGLRIVRATEAAIEASKGGAARGWVCGKCGTDRTKAACPKGHSAALTGDCPMVGRAASKGGADAN
jgi:hypothetical protein